ncbi:MAG: hypothetical protein EBR82_66715 [Caulobacteraceae bacterium]|nr:hypothetical protein [Caulobacteraceae bacterium]
MAGLDLWVKVEDGKVVQGANPLPLSVQNWGADKEALIRSGWYPVVSVKPDSMDYVTEVWESESYEINEDHVVWTLTKRSKTQEELDAELAEKWRLWRIERNFRLAETDWVIIKFLEAGQAVPAEWTAYRQALRDLPTIVDFNGLDWPVKPT